MVANELANAHRTAQLKLKATTVRDLLTIWPLLDVEDLDATFPDWVSMVAALVSRDHATSSSLAAGFLKASAIAQGVGAAVIVRAAAIPVQRIATSLLVTGPIAIKRSMTAGKSIELAAQDAFVTSSGAASNLALDGGRGTILASAKVDPAIAGWQRVASGSACAFCRMLAGRGAVYREDTSHFASHAHCGCSAEPVYDPTQNRKVDEEFSPSERSISQSTRDAKNARVREFIAANNV